MAAQKVNVATQKRFSLKKLAKKRKHIGTGDGGLMTNRALNRNK